MKKKIYMLICTVLIPFSVVAGTPQSVLKNFVTVSDDRLMDGENEFRFISFNVPNLHYIEDFMKFEDTNPWRLPDAFELRDAMKTVKHMGGTAVRTYVLSVRRQDDAPEFPRHVLGPGQFNEKAFRSLDQMLAIANETGVRVIIPFVDNWKWMGGRAEYAGFRGKQSDEFYSDAQVIADFKQTIAFVVNRVNTVSGIRYRDDRAILAWETGNELTQCPIAWIQDIMAYIKQLDPHHLVLDGVAANVVRDETVANPLADLVTTHHYERNPRDLIEHIRISAEKTKGKKPYLVGEFGFISTSGIAGVLDIVERTPHICGALLWSLRFHARDGGFYWHSEPGLGKYFYKAYHVPGFYSGETYDERNVLRLMRRRAFAIRNLTEPPPPVPEPPRFLPCDDVAELRWQGSVFAAGYDLERAESPAGPWRIIARDLSDANTAHRPLYNDLDTDIGQTYYYRVSAGNSSGISAPSNMIGPIRVCHHTLVDEFFNYGVLFSKNDGVTIQTDLARAFKEDAHRLKGEKDGEVVYYTLMNMKSAAIYFFSKREQGVLEVTVSSNGHDYQPLSMTLKTFYIGEADYNYLRPIKLTALSMPDGIRYLKIGFLHEAQITRVEIPYGP
ncbi:cellulase family glycosylhydrolase [candidate division KSB1 bacterium]|nr:cellulase family glycosylhydrolase [candidate division KSB1 bacterium]